MRLIRSRHITAGVLALLFAAAGPLGAQQAQNAVITGRVMSDVGQALEGAQVFITELNAGAVTNPAGRYTLTVPAARVSGQTVTLRARFIGHVPASRTLTLTAGEHTADFTLKTDVNRLSDVVTTGVTGATEQAKLPFTVAKVSAEQMPVPGQNPLTQLQGKVSGANIVSSNGRPGAAPSVLLRGPKSINALNRQQGPLYIVDGVLIQGGLPDLNPQDIESIEVVKGAAASSLYGSNAGNGVIQITTKRGRGAGEGLQFAVRTEVGQGDIERAYPLSERHFLRLDETRTRFCVDVEGQPACARTVDIAEEALRINERATGEQSLAPATFSNDFGIARVPTKQQLRGNFQVNRWPTEYDAVSQAVDPALFSNVNLDLTGRFAGASIFASASHFEQEGAFDFLRGYQRNSVRLNVDQQVGNAFQLALSTFYARASAGAANVDEGGTGFFRLTRVPAGVDITQRDRFGRLFVRSNPLNQGAQNSNPLYLFQADNQTDDTDRFIGGVNARYTANSWLSFDANIGYDRSNVVSEHFRDRGFRISQPSAELPLGRIADSTVENRSYNGGVNATATRQFFTDLDTRFNLGYAYEQRDRQGMSLIGIGLVVPGLGTADAATQNFQIGSSNTTTRTMSYLGGVSTTWKDRYIADALVRRDGSSLFGADERWATYGRGSLAWRLAQEPWWPVPAFSELKLRASIGTAGGRPSYAAQYETFTIGTGGALTRFTLGNRQLKPETTTEQEYGVDLELWNRVGLTANYAYALTKDQILRVPLPASTGFQYQWRNAGTLENKTWELSLNIPIITRTNLTYSTRINWDRNRTYITKLNVAPFFDGPPQQGAEQMFRFAEGERYGMIYGRKFITQCNQLPAPYASQCGGAGSAFQKNDEGLIVWVGQGNSPTEGITRNLWMATLAGCVNATSGAAIDAVGEVNCRRAGGVVNAPWGVETGWGNGILMRDSTGDSRVVGLGSTLPNFRWSVSQTLTWRKFSAYGLLDASVGQHVWNEGRHWSLGDFQVRDTDQSGKSVATAKPIGHYWRGGSPTHSAGVGGFYDQLAPNSWTVEKASYAKIREVSLSYNFGPLFRTGDWTLSLIGRNLHTFTDYTGFDPEVGRAGGITGSGAINGIDAFQYPNVRTFTFSVGSRF